MDTSKDTTSGAGGQTHRQTTSYEIHPAANIFPMMTEAEFAGLREDIRLNGQREWAVLCEGKLLDGRHRYRACQELAIELECCELEPGTDPIAYILSKNLHRRHLTPSQRAQCAADVAKMREGRPSKETGQTCPVSLENAADTFQVSRRSVVTAKHVADKGDSSVVDAVKAGEITVNAAKQLVDAVPDKKEQRRIVKHGKKAVTEKVKGAKKPPQRREAKPAEMAETRTAPTYACAGCHQYEANEPKGFCPKCQRNAGVQAAVARAAAEDAARREPEASADGGGHEPGVGVDHDLPADDQVGDPSPRFDVIASAQRVSDMFLREIDGWVGHSYGPEEGRRAADILEGLVSGIRKTIEILRK